MNNEIANRIFMNLEKQGPTHINDMVDLCNDGDLTAFVTIAGIWQLAAGGFIDIVDGNIVSPSTKDKWEGLFGG